VVRGFGEREFCTDIRPKKSFRIRINNAQKTTQNRPGSDKYNTFAIS
jgi:hypothetical protein